MLSHKNTRSLSQYKRLLCAILVLGTALSLSACGNKGKKEGQTLVKREWSGD